jgi:hypothetical protein
MGTKIRTEKWGQVYCALSIFSCQIDAPPFFFMVDYERGELRFFVSQSDGGIKKDVTPGFKT